RTPRQHRSKNANPWVFSWLAGRGPGLVSRGGAWERRSIARTHFEPIRNEPVAVDACQLVVVCSCDFDPAADVIAPDITHDHHEAVRECVIAIEVFDRQAR